MWTRHGSKEGFWDDYVDGDWRLELDYQWSDKDPFHLQLSFINSGQRVRVHRGYGSRQELDQDAELIKEDRHAFLLKERL